MNKQKLTGDFMIFKGEYGYSTAISKKNEDGTYDKMYLSIQLPKGTELENKTKINITNGFLSFWKNNQGLPQLKLVVLEFEKETNENENIESDLPF
jgi:hypothetical protein